MSVDINEYKINTQLLAIISRKAPDVYSGKIEITIGCCPATLTQEVFEQHFMA
jgi:hypothetical protein